LGEIQNSKFQMKNVRRTYTEVHREDTEFHRVRRTNSPPWRGRGGFWDDKQIFHLEVMDRQSFKMKTIYENSTKRNSSSNY
jgi:hypothetical protein